MLLPLLLAGCAGNIHELYESRKAYALEPAGTASRDWDAEAAVRVSGVTAAQLLGEAVNEAVPSKAIDLAGVGTLKPELQVKSLKLVEADDCDSCIGLRGTLDGTGTAKVGSLEKTLPLTVKFTVDLEVKAVARSEDLREIVLEVHEVRKLKVSSGEDFKIDVSPYVKEWGSEVLERIEPVSLGELGGEDMPVRDLRVIPEDNGGVRVELLTDTAHPGELSGLGDGPEEGFEVWIAEDSLLDMARRASFEQGEITLDVYGEPTSLDVDGDRFTLGLRLWRLSGSGWWRDYDITGSIQVKSKRIVLSAEEVVEVDKSKGAGLADPLAALGKFQILDAIQEACQAALPVRTKMSEGDLTLQATIARAEGRGNALVLVGTADFADPSKKSSKKSSKKKKK